MGGSDSGPGDLIAMVNWLGQANKDEEDPLYGALNMDALGVMGHSAGGGSSAAAVELDERFKAAIPMAGTGAITRRCR